MSVTNNCSNSDTAENRTRKMTERGFQHKKETLEDRSTKLRKRIENVMQTISNARDHGDEEAQFQHKLAELHKEFKDVSAQLINMGCEQHSKFLAEVTEAILTVSSKEDKDERVMVDHEASSNVNVKVQEEMNGLQILDQMATSINEDRTETEEEVAFNEILTNLRCNLQKFDDDLALGDKESVKLISAEISRDLKLLNERSAKLLANFDCEQASLQVAFMERIRYECNSRISLSNVWGNSLFTSSIKNGSSGASVSKVVQSSSKTCIKGSTQSKPLDTNNFPPPDTNNKVTKWLESQDSCCSSEKAKTHNSKEEHGKKTSSKSSHSSSSASSGAKRLKILDVTKRRLKGQLLLVESAMQTDDPEFIRKESQNLDKIYDDYLSNCGGVMEMLDEDNVCNALDDSANIDEMVFKTKQKMCLWLAQNKDTNRSCSSSSSSKTQRSSLGSKCSHKSSEDGRHSERSNNKKKTNCDNEASKMPMFQREEIKQVLPETELSIFETTKDMFKLMKAPSAEIDTFGGNPLEFEYFKSTFKEGVERLVSDQRGRLTRLIKYTSGEAKELIKHCVHADSSVCYDKAMEMLEAEYGSPHVIVSAYLQELQDWPVVKSTDSAGFRKLYRFLLRCQTYKNEHRLQELDSSTTIRHIVHKLDTSLQDKWSILAEKTRRTGRNVKFIDLVQFIDFHSFRATDPAYSKSAMLTGSKETRHDEKTAIKGFNSKTQVTEDRDIIEDNGCPLCKKSHQLEWCPIYKAKDLENKRSVIAEHHLCFKCLKPMSSKHKARTCRNKISCSKCKKEHPTSLHDDNFASRSKEVDSKEETNTNQSSNADNSTQRISSNAIQHKDKFDNNISLCIIPVYISHTSKPENEIKTYAMIDNDCTSCFATDTILKSLAPNAIRTAHISVETINGTSEQDTIAVNGLVVKPCKEYTKHYPSETIVLPTTYGFEGLPVNKNEVPTPETLANWQYLSKIFPSMSSFDESLSLGLMIGGSCPKALQPLDVIACEENGPFAYRTQLGWCTVGPLCDSTNDPEVSLKCHRIKASHSSSGFLARDAITGKQQHHQFIEPSTIKENTIDNALREMYDMEFNEVNGDLEGLSNEDECFLRKMNK